jgi:hypothetical protein
MNRLTKWTPEGAGLVADPYRSIQLTMCNDAFDRLARYEDTKYLPEDVSAFREHVKVLRGKIATEMNLTYREMKKFLDYIDINLLKTK